MWDLQTLARNDQRVISSGQPTDKELLEDALIVVQNARQALLRAERH